MLSVVNGIHAYQINIIKTQEAEEKDWEQLKNVFVDAFSQTYKDINSKDIHSNFATLSDYLNNLFESDRRNISRLNFDFIVATEEQDIAGYLLSCYCAEEKRAYILHLVVDSSRHNKGIGKNLLKACEALYKDSDFIALSTRVFNEKAIGFYKHLGFYDTQYTPEIAYNIRPNARNNPQIVHLEKVILRS